MDDLSAFLHTPAWERLQHTAGFPVERENGFLYLRRPLTRNGYYWLCSRCAISKDWQPPAFSKGAWFLRIEPESHTSYDNFIQYARGHHLTVQPTISYQPKQTSFVDLTPSEEELLAKMHSKHRYNIRLAERHQVVTEIHTNNLMEHFPRFWALLSETSERQEFRTHSEEYYRDMLQVLEAEGMVRLGFAQKDGVDLAAVLIVTCNGVATYLHGASSSQHKEYMAPHLLHWRVMQSLRLEGFRLYDFWGTNARKNSDGQWEPIAGHASSGTTRFKLGFGGTIKEYPGCFDLVFNRFSYTLYTKIRGLRSRKRAFS